MDSDVDDVHDGERDQPDRKGARLHQQGFAGEHQEQTAFHRVAHIAVGAGQHELVRGIPRSERPFPRANEQPNAVNHERGAAHE